ncbi:hypothetical protein BCR44DRAFT_35093 [Catenaria anguillulae PL171]|uniref:Uncharacterized protein n=1 Tax=Catenaria anguillulae PL171 TaxID=765915 RepID=A0A1Y2HEH3_9FUNG|nr:hypothetical protein BCR44DRAFT_35093 [Catenaria anguillulae PL171]
MTVAWEMSQWRRTSWGAVLVVGQECVRYVLAGKHKWECADQAHVVEVNARVEPGWVNYTVSAYTPPKGKHVPGEMVVGFGSTRMQRPKYRPALPSDLFYLRLRDPGSIEAVLQSVTARLRYCGLSLSLDVRGRNGGAPWDPTPNRDWHALSGSRYSLTRGGASPIEYDASPSGVDAEYEKVVRESGGQVVPWLACQVRRIHMGGEWVDVVDRATGEWVDVQDDGMWFW